MYHQCSFTAHVHSCTAVELKTISVVYGCQHEGLAMVLSGTISDLHVHELVANQMSTG